MSNYIPVFFMPIMRDELPESLESWHSAMDLIGNRLENRVEYGLRSSTSRNWWYQHALGLVCNGLSIRGLEFLDVEIVCLDRESLEAASNAVKKVLHEIRNGIPYLGSEIDKVGSIWWLHYYWEEGEYKEYSPESIRRAHDEAEVSYDLRIDTDVGYESVVGFFYSFQKSLQASINEALSQAKWLLYVSPQP